MMLALLAGQTRSAGQLLRASDLRKVRWFEVATHTQRYRYDDLASHKLTHTREAVSEPLELGSGLALDHTLEAFCKALHARKCRHKTLALSVESCRLLDKDRARRCAPYRIASRVS
jgi:hypothetical protein